MKAATKAEITLDQVTTGNMQIKILQAVMDNLSFPGVELSNETKARIQSFQNNLQRRIDQLTAQNEKVVSLVKQIPDGEVQLVLQLRYGLLDNAIKKMAWYDMPPLMNYEVETLYRRHRKGIDYLNVLASGEKNHSGSIENNQF